MARADPAVAEAVSAAKGGTDSLRSPARWVAVEEVAPLAPAGTEAFWAEVGAEHFWTDILFKLLSVFLPSRSGAFNVAATAGVLGRTGRTPLARAAVGVGEATV